MVKRRSALEFMITPAIVEAEIDRLLVEVNLGAQLELFDFSPANLGSCVEVVVKPRPDNESEITPQDVLEEALGRADMLTGQPFEWLPGEDVYV